MYYAIQLEIHSMLKSMKLELVRLEYLIRLLNTSNEILLIYV